MSVWEKTETGGTGGMNFARVAVRIQNDSGEDIKPGYLLKITGVNSDGITRTVEKPDGNGLTEILVATESVPDGDVGFARAPFDDTGETLALLDGSDTPTLGDQCGTKSGSWSLHASGTTYTGFKCQGAEGDFGFLRPFRTAVPTGTFNLKFPSGYIIINQASPVSTYYYSAWKNVDASTSSVVKPNNTTMLVYNEWLHFDLQLVVNKSGVGNLVPRAEGNPYALHLLNNYSATGTIAKMRIGVTKHNSGWNIGAHSFLEFADSADNILATGDPGGSGDKSQKITLTVSNTFGGTTAINILATLDNNKVSGFYDFTVQFLT